VAIQKLQSLIAEASFLMFGRLLVELLSNKFSGLRRQGRVIAPPGHWRKMLGLQHCSCGLCRVRMEIHPHPNPLPKGEGEMKGTLPRRGEGVGVRMKKMRRKNRPRKKSKGTA
jgi:hypothetical protein